MEKEAAETLERLKGSEKVALLVLRECFLESTVPPVVLKAKDELRPSKVPWIWQGLTSK